MTSLSERVGLHYLPWMERGECTGADPEVWFPSAEQGLGPHDIKRNTSLAKQLCWECPVRQECYQYALENDETSGIWGGHDFGK